VKRRLRSDIREQLDAAEPRPRPDADQGDKKEYAVRLSRALASLVANGLRRSFEGIQPDEEGRGHESPARTSRGVKKLDVNYSTPQLGLGLGVSIKTVNFRDYSKEHGTFKRYAKNYTRIDNELRAEAVDYHKRQPYAVMIAMLFLPLDSCDDGSKEKKNSPSSFGAAVRHFRPRTGRHDPRDESDLFEAFYVGLYEWEGERRGAIRFFDVAMRPPMHGPPAEERAFGLRELFSRITTTYERRNKPRFEWEEAESPST
jgi:hypothetical protein